MVRRHPPALRPWSVTEARPMEREFKEADDAKLEALRADYLHAANDPREWPHHRDHAAMRLRQILTEIADRKAGRKPFK